MTTIAVPDMTCGHCKASVLSALTALPDTGTVAVDLDHKTVTVSGPAAADALVRALDAVGFSATVVAGT